MPTTEERLAALEAKMAQLTDTRPTTYYTHQYSGEEIDAATGRALTGGALDTSVGNVSKELGTFARPNLLDNWYFGNPVNQRGGTEWLSSSSSAIPCVDRWNWWGQYVAGTRLNLLEDGLQITKPAEGQGQGLYQSIVQHIEKTRVPVGATVTLSALVKAEADASIVLALNSSYNILSVQANVWELITYTFNAPSVEQTYDASIQRNSGGIAFIVKAAKLELGPTQTLAHQDSAGNWMLNEVLKGGNELRECQRYHIKYDAIKANGYISNAAKSYYMPIFLPEAMRTTPTILGTPKIRVRFNGGYSARFVGGTFTAPDSWGVTVISANAVALAFNVNTAVDPNNIPVSIEVEGLELSADL